MEYLIMSLMVFAAIFALGYPLVNPRRYGTEGFANSGDAQAEQLASERDKVFDALRDFEFDRATGKLSDADYQTLRARYESKAATILQQLDALDASRAARAKHAHEPAKTRKPKVERAHTCPHCHAHVEANDRFCMKCGGAL